MLSALGQLQQYDLLPRVSSFVQMYYLFAEINSKLLFHVHRLTCRENENNWMQCLSDIDGPEVNEPTSSVTPSPTTLLVHQETSRPTSQPSEQSTSGPTSNVLDLDLSTTEMFVTSSYMCGTDTCTQDVLDAEACDDSKGGCYSCESRMNYLINDLGYSELEACEEIAYNQFPLVCGGCIPEDLLVTLPPVDSSDLIWSDEFDYEGSPDSSKWTYDIGTGSWGWGNNELQFYTDRLENAYVKDGILYIRALKESYEGSEYTSARITTKNIGDWTYGRIQVRARLGSGTATGTWPAIWMLPTDNVYGVWPASGEIDIMEHVGFDTGTVYGTVHTDSYNHIIGTQDGGEILIDTDSWHVHEIVWEEEQIAFVVDGFTYHTFNRDDDATYAEWPFDEQFHLILNMAVGGSWGGVLGVDESSFEGDGQILEIDYVRVYNV